jgi:hypothetical protein
MFFFKKKETFLHHFTTVLLTVIAVVFVWRGIWGLTDTFLFPEEPTLSYLVSIFVGLVILYIDDKRISELDHR